jgi:hypothetical protein
MKPAICILVIICSGLLQAAEPAPPAAAPKPSANKGKTGKYQSHTSHPGYDYWVNVPPSYSDDNPAGLHVFFHGQGCPQTAESTIEMWEKYEAPFNLIQVNMQYQDGDNEKDTAGKVAAAREAIAQTFADYKIVAGRGIVCSFSGGGLTHGLLFKNYAKTRGPDWPFCHSALYSSNYRVPAPGAAPPMSWFFSVGSAEWGMAKPTLGSDATEHVLELETAAGKSGVPDICFKILKGKDHHIDDLEIAEAAKGFRRSELAFAPFVYEADYDKELAPIAKQANTLALGPALSAVDRVLTGKNTPDAVKTKAESLKKHLTSRVAAILKVAQDLADNDAILCNYYGPKYTQELAGLPEAKDLQAILSKSTAVKQLPQVGQLFGTFKVQLKTMFSPSCQLSAAAVPYLEQVQRAAGEKSQFGGMATEFLLLK